MCRARCDFQCGNRARWNGRLQCLHGRNNYTRIRRQRPRPQGRDRLQTQSKRRAIIFKRWRKFKHARRGHKPQIINEPIRFRQAWHNRKHAPRHFCRAKERIRQERIGRACQRRNTKSPPRIEPGGCKRSGKNPPRILEYFRQIGITPNPSLSRPSDQSTSPPSASTPSR